MRILYIIFLIVATVFALGSIAYVILEIIFPKKPEREPEPEPTPEPIPEPIPEPEPIPVPIVIPEIVDHIDAIEADEMLADSAAMELADFEEGGCDGKQGIINIGVISMVFEPGAVVTIAVLKELGLIHKKVQRIKILADGVLDKPLTVKAESYSVQAIKMIELTGGKVIILRSPKEMERLRKLREQQQQTQPND